MGPARGTGRRRRASAGRLLACVCAGGVLSATSVESQDAPLPEWRFAAPGYLLEFPRDHAAHPDYKIEWWYYTGNLRAANGRRFGYQLTFFRVGVDREPVNPSRWAVRDLYMAHLAVTDVERDRHLVAERLNRAGVGWAGARRETLEVWNEDWRAVLDGTAHRLDARSDDGAIRIDLRLEATAAPVLHGRSGFSQKGAEPGNASYYYSLTRLVTRGTLVLDGERFEVEGASWMDHEFGSSFLEPSHAGWDWFSIQLDDGTDLMVYTLRRRDGSRDPRSIATMVSSTGTTHLPSDDYRLAPGRRWTSPSSGAAYPVEWRIAVPGFEISLDVVAAVDAQELLTDRSTGVIYWEGVIDVRGTHDGVPVTGAGYLEMTGYAGPPMSDVLR